MNYLTRAQILFVHSRLLDELGGDAGLRDSSKLATAIAAPREEFFGRPVDRYREEKAAALLHAIIRLRPFREHNDVMALVSTLVFLERNGTGLDSRPSELASLVRKVREGKFPIRDTGRWFRAHATRSATG